MLSYKKAFLLLLITFNIKCAEINSCNIPDTVFEYLKTKQVHYVLKQKLDAVFYLPEVMEALSKVYKNDSLNDVCSAQKMLIEQDFIFIDQYCPRVFQHKSFPNLIFKIGYYNDIRHGEFNNAGRIRYAELINQQRNPFLTAPIKHAYMPYIFKSEDVSLPVCFNCLPICIVVAEFIKNLDKKNNKILDDECYNKRKLLLESVGYHDGNRSNVFGDANNFTIIDTEPHGITLEYPQIIINNKFSRPS